MEISLETARLFLRPMTINDLDALAEIYRDSEVMRYRVYSKPASREQTELMLRQILNHWRQHGFGRWAFIDKMNQKLVGHGGLEILENTCDVEVNYLLTRDFWNNGLATEAAHAIVQYGFDVLRLERLVAIAHPNNRASIRVMEKIGMHYDAEVYYHDVRWLRYVIDRDSVCRH